MTGGAAILFGFMLNFVINISTDAALSVNAYPRDLQGIWFSDEREGLTQCRAFLTAYQSNADIAFDLLVGSELIRGDMWHSVAEYGEGNFYKLRRLSKTGTQSWRVEADVGIDSYPDPLESQRNNFEVKLVKRKLLLIENSLNGQSTLRSKTRRFFRCSSVPASFGRK